jgi:hypothetical protein
VHFDDARRVIARMRERDRGAIRIAADRYRISLGCLWPKLNFEQQRLSTRSMLMEVVRF